MRDAVENVTRRIVDRILRRPTARVRQGAEEGNPALPTPANLRNVFGLDDPPPTTSAAGAAARTPTEGSTEDAMTRGRAAMQRARVHPGSPSAPRDRFMGPGRRRGPPPASLPEPVA